MKKIILFLCLVLSVTGCSATPNQNNIAGNGVGLEELLSPEDPEELELIQNLSFPELIQTINFHNITFSIPITWSLVGSPESYETNEITLSSDNYVNSVGYYLIIERIENSKNYENAQTYDYLSDYSEAVIDNLLENGFKTNLSYSFKTSNDEMPVISLGIGKKNDTTNYYYVSIESFVLIPNETYHFSFIDSFGIESFVLMNKIVDTIKIKQPSSDAQQVAREKRNCLVTAISYLSHQTYSKNSLYNKLLDGGFTEEEASYAVENCGADWNEEAITEAKSFLNSDPFSRQGLFEELLDIGFTEAESNYAVDNCGADWNEQAAKEAKSYLERFPHSKDFLIQELIHVGGFTQEQAEYGVSVAFD